MMADRMAEFGIQPDLSFTLGYPEDPRRDVQMSLDLGRELKRRLPGAVFVLNTYTPYESTPLYSDALLHGLKKTRSLADWESEEWRDFGFRKQITPWMTPEIDGWIRDFETVAGTAFFVAEDLYRYKGVQMRARPVRDAMIALARRRWNRRDFSHPFEVKAARKLFFLLNRGLTDLGPSLVDGHQAGVKPERPEAPG
jgi:radical SAM superfamily enzyme YgiQ (UPF0313 family)